MREGKHEKTAVKNSGKGKKSVAVITAVSLLLALAVGGTVAYIAAQSVLIKNQFQPAQVSCEVQTSLTSDKISVKNTSDVSAYIRAAIVVNWMDKDDVKGPVYGLPPVEGTDYKLTLNTVDTKDTVGWKKIGDFYYWTEPVSADTVIGTALVENITVIKDPPSSEYELTVEVVAEAIQADGVGSDGKTAAESAWGEAAANALGLKN